MRTPLKQPLILKVPLALGGKRLDQALAELLPDFSRSRLTAMIKTGDIKLDGATAQPKTKLLGGETVAAAGARSGGRRDRWESVSAGASHGAGRYRISPRS